MKKGFKKIIALFIMSLMLVSAFACGNNVKPNDGVENKTIEIKAVIAGYGIEWLEEAIKEFNEMYKEEGYKAVLTEKDTELNTVNEISIPKRNTTDIFFHENVINQLVNKSRSILKTGDVALLEDLSDVYNSKAIGKSKQEEGKTILERFPEELQKAVTYTGALKGYEGLYGMPWQGGTTGIYVNKKVVEDAGYTLDDLATTDKLIEFVKDLAPADPLDTNAIFPIAWSGLKAPGYWDYITQVLFAQYEGKDSYTKFWNFIPDSGNVETDGYKVYEKQGIYESLKITQLLENKDYAAPGTSSIDHIGAQARVFTGTSAMMISGDWIYKEMEKDYGDYLNDVMAIRTPVISALGVKLNLCGASHTADTICADCDEILHSIVLDVDKETLTDAEIAAKFDANVTADKVKTIREARGYYQGSAYSTLALVPSYSDAKTGAKLFLKYLYSDDGMKTYKSNTYVDLLLDYTVKPDISGYEDFLKAMSVKTTSANSIPVSGFSYETKLRTVANLSMYPKQGTIVSVYTGLSYSHSNATSKPQFTASEVYESNKSYVKASWPDYLRQAGLN